MESTGPEDSKNVKTSQAYFFEGFISFFEDFSLTIYVCGIFNLIPRTTALRLLICALLRLLGLKLK